MYGFLINVFDKGEIFEDGWIPTPIIYHGKMHVDPGVLPPYCYGDHPEKKTGLKSFQAGDALIFHTTLVNEKGVPDRYIIGGFQARMVKLVNNLSQEEINTYKLNPHIMHGDIGATLYFHTVPLFPKEHLARPRSPFLKQPLLFDKELADEIQLNIEWKDKFRPYQQIAWSTRAVRKIESICIQHIINCVGGRNGKSKR